MAETETDTDNSNTQRRSKIIVTGGVGGIAGVLIIGGVVAVASLLRNRASKKERDVNNPKTPSTPQELDQTGEYEGEGLRSLVQTIEQEDYASGAASSQSGCDSEPEEIVETPTMEHEPYIEENEEMHISSTDRKHTIELSTDENSSNSEDVSDTNNYGVTLASSDRLPDAIKDGVPSSDGVSALNCDRVLLSDDSHQLPSLPLHEETSYSDDYTDDHDDNEEDEDDEDDDDDEEIEEEEESSDEDEVGREREGSEWTGDSSIGSHSEAIWPADSIEKELFLLKNRAPGKVFGETVRKEDSEKIAKVEEDEFELMNCLSTKKESGSRPLSVRFKSGFSMMLLLVVGLLYLLFAHHLPLLYHSKDSQLSSSI